MKITDQMVAAANAEAPELKPETVRRMLEASTRVALADNPNGIADDLANRLMRLHRALEDRGNTGDDWSIARALEDRIGAYQPSIGDFERATQLLEKHGF